MPRALYVVQRGKCFICGRIMSRESHNKKRNKKGWTRDHVFPKTLGGKQKDNLVLTCIKCNKEKKDSKPDLDFIFRARNTYRVANRLVRHPKLGNLHDERLKFMQEKIMKLTR